MLHGGDIEPVNRRSTANARRVQLIIHALGDRFVGEPFPAQSSHFKPEVPGQIGSVVFRTYEPSPTLVEDSRTGMDMAGNWHCHAELAEPFIKTEMDRWQPS